MSAFYYKNPVLSSTFILLFSLICPLKAKNYCTSDICGNNKQHTLCKFSANEPAHRCVNHERTIKTDKDKQDILNKINSRRNKVASGDIRSLPPAENMHKMEWNEELEMFAQRWADQCVPYKELDTKDSCRDLGNVYVGQNIATVVGESPGLTPAILVDVWYMELLNMNASLVSRYRTFNQSHLQHYHYFTQLVWAESNLVGCGAVKFKELIDQGVRNRTINRLVCNFAPAGNLFGRSVYIEGSPCSRCTFGEACDSIYTSLCGFTSPTMKQAENESVVKVFNKNVPYISLNASTIVYHENKTIKNKQEYTDKKFLKTFSFKADDEDATTFDYFAHLFDSVGTTENITTSTVITCKDIMAVEDFIEIFKKRLVKDHALKEFLLTSKITENKENSASGYTDANVADFVGKIYSEKELSTTQKSTEPDYFNSTLLVNLIEAVIFNNNDGASLAEKVEQSTQFHSDIKAIKINAELGEIRTNSHFTGHYFFPEEDNEQGIEETTEYYDISTIPETDIVSEIEDLKRNKGTKDFLDEILESDFNTESMPKIDFPSSDKININENGNLTDEV